MSKLAKKVDEEENEIERSKDYKQDRMCLNL